MKNRLNAFLLAAVFSLSLFGCGSADKGIDEIVIIGQTPPPEVEDELNTETEQSIIATCGDFELSSSLYSLLIYDNLVSVSDEYGIDIKDIADKEVMDSSGAVLKAGSLAEKNAASEFRRAFLAFDMINGLGGRIEDCSGYASIASEAQEDYIAKLSIYDRLGVSLQDIVISRLSDSLYRYVFSLLYGEGGDHEIAREELEKIMEERMRRVEYTFLPFYDDETMELLPKDRIKELKAQSADYLKRFKKGEDFTEIVKENYLQLAGYDLFFDVENTDIYYSVFRSDFSAEIAEKVEKLKDGNADMVNAEYYTAVVLRLPVNGNEDGQWLEAAMEEAYYSPFGKEFNSDMEGKLLTLPEMEFLALKAVTAESVINRIA